MSKETSLPTDSESRKKRQLRRNLTEKKEITRYDKRAVASIDKKLKSWYMKTKMPTVALSLIQEKTGKIHVKYSGPPEFREFGHDPGVIKKFVEVALKGLQGGAGPGNLDGKTKQDEDLDQNLVHEFLQPDLLTFDAVHKRKMIAAAVCGTGRLKSGSWNSKPSWWPIEVDFRTPFKTPKLTVNQLDIILKSYRSHIAGKQLEANGDDYQSNEEFVVDTEAMDMAIVESIKENIEKLQVWNEESICIFFASSSRITNWQLLREIFSIESPIPYKRMEVSNHGKSIEPWYRHLVPCNLRDQGLEPVNVIGDGNCFYRAIAVHLSEDEKQWAHVKFECLKYGILNLDTIIAKLVEIFPERAMLQAFMTEISNDEDAHQDSKKHLKKCLKDELKNSLQDGRYSSLLHVILAAGAFSTKIISLSQQPVSNAIIDLNDGSNSKEIIIMWVPSVPKGSINHVIPITCPTKPFKLCIGDDCATCYGEEPGDFSVTCGYCMNSFHAKCAGMTREEVRSDPWLCGCHIKVEHLESLAKFAEQRHCENMLQQYSQDIKRYLQSLVRGQAYSIRMALLKRGLYNKLVCLPNPWLTDNAHTESFLDFVMRFGQQLPFSKRMSFSQRTTMNVDVLFPEVLIFLLQRLENLTRIAAQRILVEVPK